MLNSRKQRGEAAPVLPVCLGSENPLRLVSLLDIVNQFNTWQLGTLVSRLQNAEDSLEHLRKELGGGRVLGEFAAVNAALLREVQAFALQYEYRAASDFINMCARRLEKRSDSDVSTVETDIRHAKVMLLREVHERRFLFVAGDRSRFVDQRSLMGLTVYRSFPSARRDVTQAGNSLAAECPDAAVFHLMRAAEYGLRALAWDRRVNLPRNAALDLATWEDIIRQLEIAETAIQGYPKTLAREKQYEFYHGAMMEFKRFKNLFRNRIMHAREDYDRDQAHSAFTHVHDFMQILAGRISETKRTPLVWKRA